MGRNTFKSAPEAEEAHKEGRKLPDVKGMVSSLPRPWEDDRYRKVIGIFFLGFSLFLFLAFCSYLVTGKADQRLFLTEMTFDADSTVQAARDLASEEMLNEALFSLGKAEVNRAISEMASNDTTMEAVRQAIREVGKDQGVQAYQEAVVEVLQASHKPDKARNALGWLGAYFSHLFVYKGFGLGAFFVPPFIFLLGLITAFRKNIPFLGKIFRTSVFLLFYLSLTLGYFATISGPDSAWAYICGGIGFEWADLLNSYLSWGAALVLLFLPTVFVIFTFNPKSFSLEAIPVSWPLGYRKNLEDEEDDEDFEDDDDVVSDSEVETTTQSIAQDAKKEPEETYKPESKKDDEVEMVLKVEDDSEDDLLFPEDEPEDEHPLNPVLANQNEGLRKEEPQLVIEDDEEEEDDLGMELKVENGPVETVTPTIPNQKPSNEPSFVVEDITDEPDDEGEVGEEGGEEPKEAANKFLEQAGEYDPHLDLPHYKFPTIDLMQAYETGGAKKMTREELEQYKNRIIETLSNYKIGIDSIKATIGPTVTLYEIVPQAGVKISKIKNLEDDIALSLAALGIRIIAPIPGRGTIGIEVPNKTPEMVAMRTALTSEKFKSTDMALPVVFGKTISNEVFMVDLAKMPHILIAGATGQGKSVGLNVLLTSLLYKKHPSELKFVLVDPKKVELSIFSRIEKHFLAKMPNSEEAIITDTKKVIHTLNSLCIEMDARYDLLKDAGCRNLKEYNRKFQQRRLNPEKGHRFLPYIVLVIDELADLMMTAGKEVETPIARLAQLARAIGIHLVVATQRPSVNVITGIIKANFPARLSFRVTSKIDSRTILDAGGAEQLIGKGDMLFSQGSDMVRVQCAFVDTPEVDNVVDFIGDQRGYSSAFMLPEYVDNESEGVDVDLKDRDVMFEEAARLIVQHQQGSTSLIQRKLKLGYNRAGRIVDQLEAAGIVGPFEGSKAREVLVPDEYALEQLLDSLGQ